MNHPKEAMMATAKVRELIDNGKFEEAEKALADLGETTEALARILSAEVELYFSRFEPVPRLLGAIDPLSLDARTFSRYLLVQGDYALSQLELEQARVRYETAYSNYRLFGEPTEKVTALIRLGRMALVQGKLEEAARLLGEAEDSLAGGTTTQCDFLRGVVRLYLGACRFSLGQSEEAKGLLDSAVALLEETERCRYYAAALTWQGELLAAAGKYGEAVELLNEAHILLSRYSISDELARASSRLAAALVRLGRYDEAHRVLGDSLDIHQRMEDTRGAAHILYALADFHLERNEIPKAEKIAAEALAQATQARDDLLQASIHIVAGRAAARRRDTATAEKELLEALHIAETFGDKRLEGLSCLYLADTYYGSSPVKAQEYVTRASDILQVLRDPWLDQELQRIAQRSTSERIKLTADNKLIFDGNFLPNWYSAKEALEQFLLKNALKQAGGNLTKAGEILGITKVHVHNLRKQFGI
jgi:tetratricopeptide (TPR) repeat protein